MGNRLTGMRSAIGNHAVSLVKIFGRSDFFHSPKTCGNFLIISAVNVIDG